MHVSATTTTTTLNRTKDLQLDDLKSTLELLQQKHYILIDENKKVNAEVDRHLKIIEQLTGLNKDVSSAAGRASVRCAAARPAANLFDLGPVQARAKKVESGSCGADFHIFS